MIAQRCRRSCRARAGWLAAAVVVGGGVSLPAAAIGATLAPSLQRVSVDAAGADADGGSFAPALSADGRFVAFESSASDLVAGDGNGVSDVFVRDRLAGTTTRVSVDRLGDDADGGSTAPSISASGRLVAFESRATDLVADDTGGFSDVFLRDVAAGTTARMSADLLGSSANAGSFAPALSADGRHVAFESVATDLVTGEGSGTYDVFVRDRLAQTTTRVSVDAAGTGADEASFLPDLSRDGRYVVFYSFASDLVPADENGTVDVFRWDREVGVSTRMSVDRAGGDADAPSFDPVVSDDGRYVSFTSVASDLVRGDGNGIYDVFVRDALAGTTVRASVDTAGIDADGRSLAPALSGDGRRLAFSSYASDLVVGDANHLPDVFLWAR